jgi:hypothetical protein
MSGYESFLADRVILWCIVGLGVGLGAFFICVLLARWVFRINVIISELRGIRGLAGGDNPPKSPAEVDIRGSKREVGKETKGKNKFTVYYDQVSKVNYQVLADDMDEAFEKGDALYKKAIGSKSRVKEGWSSEEDGEDK